LGFAAGLGWGHVIVIIAIASTAHGIIIHIEGHIKAIVCGDRGFLLWSWWFGLREAI
jgi:hypothetical protein